MGFEKLIDFIISQIKNIIPIAVVFQFQNGMLYRFGRFKKKLLPGWYLKIPYIDAVAVENVTDTTMLLPAQSISTGDDIQIVVQATVGYRVVDIVKFYNNGNDVRSLVSDNAGLVIRQQTSWKNYAESSDIEYGVILRHLLQKEVKDYGVKINFIGFISISETPSIRIYSDNVKLES